MDQTTSTSALRISAKTFIPTETAGAARLVANAQTVVTTTDCSSVVSTNTNRPSKGPAHQWDITHEREYVRLSEDEQSVLYGRLLEGCHSEARLQIQGYRLTVEPPEKKPRKDRRAKSKSAEGEVAEDKASEKQDPEEKAVSKKEPEKKPTEQKCSKKPSKDKPTKPIYFMHTPTTVSAPWHQPRKAIALDCEMVMVLGGQDEVAFLSAVDFLTGEVLIHRYVQPTKKVIQWRSSVSGISPAAMATAVSTGQALAGWASARQELWKYTDRNTVLVGHCLNHDLNVLRVIHPLIVDSSITSAEAVFSQLPNERLRRVWALKACAEMFLDRRIQRVGKNGHDCLEDAYATRDVVIWCLMNPVQLRDWADNARAEHELKIKQMREEHGARQREKKEKEEKEEKEKLEKEAKEKEEKEKQGKEREVEEKENESETPERMLPDVSLEIVISDEAKEPEIAMAELQHGQYESGSIDAPSREALDTSPRSVRCSLY